MYPSPICVGPTGPFVGNCCVVATAPKIVIVPGLTPPMVDPIIKSTTPLTDLIVAGGPVYPSSSVNVIVFAEISISLTCIIFHRIPVVPSVY
jgi:hypothetical protein